MSDRMMMRWVVEMVGAEVGMSEVCELMGRGSVYPDNRRAD